MQIVCPNCKTSYQVADSAIRANGRPVRCVRCQTVWQAVSQAVAAPADDATLAAFRAELGAKPPNIAAPQIAPSETPPGPSPDDLAGSTAPDQAADDAAAPADPLPVALSEIPIPVEDAPPLVPAAAGDAPPAHVAEMDNGPPDVESVAARRARAAARKRRARRRIPLSIAIVALIALSVALVGWRRDIVRHAPQLASFYSAIGMPVNIRGLAFADLKIGNEIHDGVPVLVVEGIIVSTVSKPVEVPRLRFALRSATGAEVYAWTAQPPQPVLGAFETLPFRSRLASPPAEGHDIQVRFFTRRDAVAGLR